MDTTKRLWRWRSNPLRRREDVVEAWIVLIVWALALLGGALAALVTAGAAENQYAEQRAHRHSVRAVLLADAPHGVTTKWSADSRVQGSVRWTAPDGTLRTGRTLVDGGLKAGTPVTVWQDDQGRLVLSKPAGRAEGHVEAGLFGAAAALAVAAPVFGAGAAARAWLDRRRLAHWDQEWDLVGPQWGPRTG
ncbi:Rv1733c family protein [Streptomyces capoamus]|uniref:Rv1733c family protein n=1 Tax=Streptomyces capoamus TaxID=68183 RepID=UPI003391B6D5